MKHLFIALFLLLALPSYSEVVETSTFELIFESLKEADASTLICSDVDDTLIYLSRRKIKKKEKFISESKKYRQKIC